MAIFELLVLSLPLMADYWPWITAHPAVSPKGDGTNDFLMVEGIRDYPENRMVIFDRSGNIITEIESYDNQARGFTADGVCDGTYFYRLIVTINGKRERVQGFSLK